MMGFNNFAQVVAQDEMLRECNGPTLRIRSRDEGYDNVVRQAGVERDELVTRDEKASILSAEPRDQVRMATARDGSASG